MHGIKYHLLEGKKKSIFSIFVKKKIYKLLLIIKTLTR
jgi:hypothetical protein